MTGDDAQGLFDQIAAEYLARPGVTYGRIWHNDGLKVNNKIFAMIVRDELVVKVPAGQAAQLIDAGDGVAFEPRPGRRMKEWVVVGIGRRSAVAPPHRRCVPVRHGAHADARQGREDPRYLTGRGVVVRTCSTRSRSLSVTVEGKPRRHLSGV